jgi:hypothetical protein
VLAPLVALAAYVAVFAARSDAIVRTLYLNADIASGPVVAQSLVSAPGHTEVLLGNYAWFEALGLLSILRVLPAHRFLWEATPFALALAAMGLVAWGTGRAGGRRAALLALAIGAAASPATVADLGTWTVHGLTWVHTALLGWLAVWLARGRSRRAALCVAAVVGLVCGPALASDPLLIPGGLLPLWTTTLVLALRRRTERPDVDAGMLLGGASLATATAAIGALATVTIAHAENIRGAGTLPIELVRASRLGHNLQVLWESLAVLGNGDVFNVAFGGSTLIHAVCAGLAVVGVVAALCAAWSAFTAASSAVRVAHAAFWGSTMLALLGAFVLSSVPVAAFSGRYLVGVLMGVAALAPLAVRRGRGVLAIAAVTCFVLVGVMSLVRGEMTANPDRFPSSIDATRVARFAASESAGIGYAGYWDAAPITWASSFATHVYPVAVCAQSLCAYELHRVASWYAPRPGGRSFLVLDRTVRQVSLQRLPPAFGKPVASADIGQLDVYIFDGDIARYFGAPLRGAQA